MPLPFISQFDVRPIKGKRDDPGERYLERGPLGGVTPPPGHTYYSHLRD